MRLKILGEPAFLPGHEAAHGAQRPSRQVGPTAHHVPSQLQGQSVDDETRFERRCAHLGHDVLGNPRYRRGTPHSDRWQLEACRCGAELQFNRSLDRLEGDLQPAAVADLASAVAAADEVVIASREYNHSIPQRLKNAIDWLSRLKPNPMAGKPVMLTSPSPGPLGKACVHYDWRRVLTPWAHSRWSRPKSSGNAVPKFDAQRACIDEATRTIVRRQLQAFGALIECTRRLEQLGHEQD